MYAPSIADDLDPLQQPRLSLRGCHCGCHSGSFTFASPHAAKQTAYRSPKQGGPRRRDTEADILIADKAFDADERVIEPLAAAGKTAVIPSKANRRSPRDYDRDLYKARHLIENFFAKLKQFRAIATRYDKTARNFLAAVHLAASAIWLN